MTERLLTIIAMLVLVAFLLILAVALGRLDLWLLVLVTLALAAWDFFGPRRG